MLGTKVTELQIKRNAFFDLRNHNCLDQELENMKRRGSMKYEMCDMSERWASIRRFTPAQNEIWKRLAENAK